MKKTKTLNVPAWANNQHEKALKREALRNEIYEERIETIKDWLCLIIPVIIVALVVIF